MTKNKEKKMDPVLQQSLGDAVEFVKKASPYVWQVTYKDTIITAVEGVLFGIGLVGASFWGIRQAVKALMDDCYDDWPIGVCFAGGILTIVGLCFVGSYLPDLINPGFTTLQHIVALSPAHK